MVDMTDVALPDPITLEVVRNALLSCSYEMKADLRRTSYNPIINEMNDFSVGVFSKAAETLAQAPGLPHFVCDIPSAIKSIERDIGGITNFNDGDIFLTNDPYANTFHVHDVNAIKPVFYDGALLGFTGARAHWHDIGGASAAGNLTATDIFQEGLILKSVRLYVQGALNEDVLRVIRENTRLPNTVLGDIRAQVGACNVGARRLVEVIKRYGVETYESCSSLILAEGERQARKALELIPNGEYEAESCIDDDGINRGIPLVIRARVLKDDDSFCVDLTGSAESCSGGVNSNYNTSQSCCRLIFKMLTTPKEPANEGHFRMVSLKVPDQSIFNAHWPSATLPGFFSLHTLEDVVKRALAVAFPHNVTADDYGKCTPAHIKFRTTDGMYRIVADTEGGGWGAKPHEDGENAMLFGEVRTIPIEILETRYPVMVERYTLRIDSGGPGRYRGGLGIIKEYRCLSDAELNAGFDRQTCPPEGILGGGPAATNRVVIRAPDGSENRLPSKVTDFPVPAGYVISLQTGGGGGYGPPARRSLEEIAEDLRHGYISEQMAEAQYDVVIGRTGDEPPRVDRKAVEPLPAVRGAGGAF